MVSSERVFASQPTAEEHIELLRDAERQRGDLRRLVARPARPDTSYAG